MDEYNNIADLKKFNINEKKLNVLIFPFCNAAADEIYDSLKYTHHVNLINDSYHECGNLINSLTELAIEKSIDLFLITDQEIEIQVSKNDYLRTYLLNGHNSIVKSLIKDSKSLNFTIPQSILGVEFDVLDPSIDTVEVSCFTDFEHNLIWIGCLYCDDNRRLVRQIDTSDNIIEVSHRLNKILNFRGYWSFRAKRDINNDMDISHISSVLNENNAVYRSQGVNLPLMIIQDYLQRKQITIQNTHCKEMVKKCYPKCELSFDFDKVFVDLDGTLIINDCVCPIVIAFIFQMKAMGKKINLITRHLYDPISTLSRVCISDGLFDEIIHIKEGELKSHWIDERSIFIDNEFPERRSVFQKKNIPCFDVDTLKLFFVD